MATNDFLLGPVLSFRGVGQDGTWKVTALIGIREGAEVPKLRVEGRACAAPTQLLIIRKERYLRYDLSCKAHKDERRVEYGVEGGPLWHFTVPGKDFAPRMAYVSCNGFSDPAGMRRLVRPANAVWEDLLVSHDKLLRGRALLDKEQLWHEVRIHDKGLQRFHVLLMGGDQIYFDSIWEDIPELKHWVSLARAEQLKFSVSTTLERKIEAYYFTLYRQRWLSEKRRPWGTGEPNRDAADALARIPTVMMWDDHDIFDGWGSYTPEMQRSPLFQTLFRHARRAFWVFQMQHALDDLPELVDGTPPGFSSQDPILTPIAWSMRLKKDSLALPLLDNQPGFTSVFQAGPLALVVADLRTERSRTQVLGAQTWRQLKDWLSKLDTSVAPRHPGTRCQHLLFMSSVPVAHPKLGLAEGVLDNVGQDHVLDSSADDLRDHWSHDDHEGERKRLLEVLSETARLKRLRVSLLSGDVHVAAWGTAYRRDLPASETWAQIQQFTSSAVVHPSLMGVVERLFLGVLNSSARTPQTIDVQYNVEMMLFPGQSKYVMPARNWLALELDVGNDEAKLWATWRCETETAFSNHLQTVPPARQG
ncbi:alkaline phosphatase family protein [Pseudomonas sp. JM0905a]|uniref:Alkaline phosphatase family protein n=1 Tax=Metapseudomonas resinovorans TaxID=53412 RepID=A0ABT4Y1H5_METRE|nr:MULTISPECIES: alkaline phosphatase family protein [Pseudomonas]MBD2839219.1 alkaline phosphatase family protein [Pseudomonas sp. JM0905a]MDA8482678.1 alkaline phosphatase family protein [Pseudomonas resinovorans]